MFLLSFLLLELSLLDFKYLFIWLPSLLSMQEHFSFVVYCIGYLRKRIITTVGTQSNFFVTDSKLIPTEIALIDKTTDAAYPSTVERKKFNSDLYCDVLQGKITAD